MRRVLLLAAAIAAAASSSVPVQAATGSHGGSLSGTVRTRDGHPVPHIVLTLTAEGGADPAVDAGRPSAARTVVTGPEGRYRADALPSGRYRVDTRARGFVIAGPAATDVHPDGPATLDVVLDPAPVREHVVVAATRDEAAASTLGVTTTVLDPARIAERAATSVLELLEEVPGLVVARNGGVGLQGSIFLRGGESNFVRILVDGVPVNEPGGELNLGPQLPLELERVEVVRGAASSLYGTDALAGVIHLVTRRFPDAPRWRAEAQAGSDDWLRGEAGAAGASGPFDWNLGLAHLRTDNQEPNSAFRQDGAAATLGFSHDAAWTARLSLRGDDTEVGTPGSTAFGRPDLDARFERRMAVAGLHVRHVRGRTSHELRAGLAAQDWLSVNPLDSGPYTPRQGDLVGAFAIPDFPDPLGFQQDTRRLSSGYQVETQLGGRHLLAAGLEVERETGEVGSRSDVLLSPRRTNVGLYVQDRVVFGDRLFLTAGGRVERNASFGTHVVPRVAAALAMGASRRTTLKASGGTGIKEPTFFESYGVSFFAQGNPDLEPERSLSLDAGLEHRALGDRLRLEATAFHQDYRDQVNYQVVDPVTFQGTFVNLGHTRARGLELGAEAAPRPGLRVFAQYTFLDGEILVSGDAFDPVYAAGRPLLRRPRHQGSLTASVDGARAGAGATLVASGRRSDSDFLGLGLSENGGYARLDLRARLRLAPRVEALVVAENALDRRYQQVLGYPALGRSIRVGLRLRAAAGDGR